jgi:hypothetical protein
MILKVIHIKQMIIKMPNKPQKPNNYRGGERCYSNNLICNNNIQSMLKLYRKRLCSIA